MTDEIMKRECLVAKKYDCASVCIKPYAIDLARDILEGSDVLVGTVIGFPHGNSTISIKEKEAVAASEAGAVEIDMVVNIGKVLGNDWDYIWNEIGTLNQAVISHNGILKVIFETDFLQDDQVIKLCEICSQHNVAFVKTSTGYGFVKNDSGMYSYKGATEHNLKLMRQHSKPSVQVKAAGGVRTLEDLLKVRSLGVTRIGATATAAMLDRAAEVLKKGGSLEDLAYSEKQIGGTY